LRQGRLKTICLSIQNLAHKTAKTLKTAKTAKLSHSDCGDYLTDVSSPTPANPPDQKPSRQAYCQASK
jgi:hypothetical protein